MKNKKMANNILPKIALGGLMATLSLTPTIMPTNANAAVSVTSADAMKNSQQFAAGYFTSLIIKNDGTLWGTGENQKGEQGLAGTTTTLKQASNDTGIKSVALTKTMYAASNYVKGDGSVVAMGSTIGLSGSVTNAVSVSVSDHTMALKADGTVWSWGASGWGQLGNGTGGAGYAGSTTTPVQATGLSGVIQVAAGITNSYALRNDGTLWAWGNWNYAYTGNSNPAPNTPQQVMTNVAYVSAGDGYVLVAKKDGTVWGWGANDHAQLGIGSTTPTVATSPTQVVGVGGSGNLNNIVAVAAGTDTSYALSSDGHVYSWGYGFGGVLGNGTSASSNQTSPILVTGISDVVGLQAGQIHVLAMKSDGSMWGWGGYRGELGQSMYTRLLYPTKLGGITATPSTPLDVSPPIPATITADITAPTNLDVTLTVTYPADAAKKEYRLNGGAWTNYTTPIVMPTNGTLEARGTDEAGNVSTISSYTVLNIDKVAPTTPTLSADKTTPTTGPVLVSITYPSDASVKEFRYNGSAWMTYAAPVAMSENGTVEARAIDAAGNISGIGSYVVGNIGENDTITPPTFVADKTNPTNGNVTVTINYPSNGVVNEYKLGESGSWTAYTKPLVISENKTIFARSTTSGGTVSEESSYVVNNIDKTAPTTPTLLADKTTPTTGDVVVTITYPEDATVKEYRVNGGSWTAYTSAVTMTANGTVEARATDAAGNVSTVGSLSVANIDKTVPTTPTFTADKTTPTNGNVTVSIAFSANSITKEYRVNGGAWTAYTSPVVMNTNGLVEARGTNSVGNISSIGSYTVNNIDKTAPDAPTLTADITTPTTGVVKVTVTYPADAQTKQYKLGSNGSWQTYSSPINLSSNNTVYARGLDAAGNVSEEGNLVVSNISKSVTLPPTTFSADVVTKTNGNVTLTIKYPSVATIKEYKIGDTGAWVTYSDPLVLTENVTVYARSQDEAGNKSNDSSYTVSNIDKEAPTPPTIKISGNQLTISSGTDNSGSVSSRYKINNASWTAYAGVMTLDDGQYTVQAKSVDQAGNESTVVTSQFVVYVQALKTATDAVKAAEANATQNMINSGYDAVNLLPDVAEKQALLDRLDKLVELWMQAEDAVTNMESTPTQGNVDLAKSAVAKLPNSPEKTDLLNRIQIVQDELNNQQAIFAAQSLVTKAEGTLSKSDYDKATTAVNGLKNETSKNELQDRLEKIADEVNAVAAVVRAEQTRLQVDINYGRELVHLLENGQLKEDLLTRLNRIDTAYTTALTKVKQAETALTQASVDDAQSAINVLSESPDKTDLQTRLDAVKKQIADKAYADQISKATAKVVQAEQYKRDPYLSDAWTLVNALPAGADKDGLVARLNALAQSNQDQANADQLAKATAKVQQAETYKRDPYLTDAWTLVNALLASADKDALIDRLNAINSGGSSSTATQLAKATAKVGQAETYKRDPYLTDAWTLVNALSASSDKDALIARLNAIVPNGTVSPAVQLQKATAKVQQAETYKRDPYITDAWTLVNALPAGADKDALVQRLNAISSGSSTPTDPALESAQNYVAIYEKYKTSYYKTKAQNAVNALPDGADKTALQARIDAVV